MPWREVCYMDERVRFVAAALKGEESMTGLCAQFGISRKSGYQLLARYRVEGLAGLEKRSHAPHRVPWAISGADREAILGLRRARPSWGPKKLRAKLMEQAPEQSWPALSTIGDLLRRNGLVAPRRRRRHALPSPLPMMVASAPNQVWAVDFKGWFRTADGARCDPLTVSDQFSRYLLCARIVSPDSAGVRPVLERLFRECGLPRVIRSDNGPPFASAGAGGLTLLSVWWVKLGIVLERIWPGKPQQNGAHERMHRTLKAETATSPAASCAAQQLRFDAFRTHYNHERPHEALGLKPPASFYHPSPRPYPARLEDPCYPTDYLARRVRTNGMIKWRGELIFISQALTGEVLGLRDTDDGDAQVYFGPLLLGRLDARARQLVRLPVGRSMERRGGLPSSHSTPPGGKKVLPILPV